MPFFKNSISFLQFAPFMPSQSKLFKSVFFSNQTINFPLLYALCCSSTKILINPDSTFLSITMIYSKLSGIFAFLLGVEKLNDVCRRVHLHRSNKWDAAKDVLLVGKRMEHLADCERGVRQYKKQNLVYWEEGIKESRAKRHRVCMQPAEVGHLDFEMLNNLTVDEIKLRLKNLGVKTRYRCKKKLKELLVNTLEDKENAIL